MQKIQQKYYESVSSTLDVAKADFPGCGEEMAVYYTFCQLNGRGQVGNGWYCGRNKNMAVTLAIRVGNLDVENLYGLNMVLSLGMLRYAVSQASDAVLKWPNDVYLRGKKIAGVLLESRCDGPRVNELYFGAGFNINEELFPAGIPHPGSFFLFDGVLRNLEEQVRLLSECLVSAYSSFLSRLCSEPESEVWESIRQEYRDSLLFLGIERTYVYKGNPVKATIFDVCSDGRLQLKTSSGSVLEADVKELQFFPGDSL